SDRGWKIIFHTLHIRHNNCLLIRHPHLSRRQLRMNHSIPPCQRSIHILYLPLHPRRTRPLLRLLHIPRDMKHWNYPTFYSNSHSIHGLCPTMRPNILLRGNSHHKPPISNPLHRYYPC
uniref:Uncharacterized protein n=1 Tax=Equus asinus TaxID=9793 RepID=A0A8C4LU49_EQUAS